MRARKQPLRYPESFPNQHNPALFEAWLSGRDEFAVDSPLQRRVRVSHRPGTNLGLFAGTIAEFESGTGGMQLSDSGGPGFQFLTIIGTQQLWAKLSFVRREVGSANSQFTLTVD